MSAKINMKVIKLFDYVLTNKPSGYNVSLTIDVNGNYQINLIKE